MSITTPRIIITTSRRPTRRIRSFVKDLEKILPNAERMNRGHYSMEELAQLARLRKVTRLVIISGLKGNPSLMRIYEVREDKLKNIVSLIIKGVSLSREVRRPLPPKQPDYIVIDADDTEISAKISDALVKAFYARVLEKPGKNAIKAIIRSIDKDVVLVEFEYNNKLVGPKIKISLTKRSLEDDQGNL